MNLRIYNVNILTMEEGTGIFKGEVHIQGDTISYVGASIDGQIQGWDQEVDGEGNLLMPGFKNAHTHSGMTFLRSHADDMKLDEWLNTRVFPAEAKLTQEDIYWCNKLAIMEYLTSGVTAVFDMYISKPMVEKAAFDTGFRVVICDGINDFGGSVEDMEAAYRQYNQDPNKLVSYQLGFHAEYTTSPRLMEGIVELSEKYNKPIYVHCSETKREVDSCKDRTGMTPVAYMDSMGVFSHGGGLFHGVHIEDKDFEIIQKRGLHVVTNPSSNLKLASGIAPVKCYLDRGVSVSIGTDGPASNNCLDMFREMFLVTGLQKVLCDDPEAVPAIEVLKMATVKGAHAMGLSNCDLLLKGKKADMILIDLMQPNMQPMQNIERNLVYSGSKSNVKMTIVGGQILYKDGKFYLDSTKEEIYRKSNEVARRILG